MLREISTFHDIRSFDEAASRAKQAYSTSPKYQVLLGLF